MNKLKYIFVIITLLFVWSCENTEYEYKDFDYTTCYFPFQSPVRNLTLGKYDQGYNENDNNHQFEIGIILGGVYSNKEDRSVEFKVDNNLLSPLTGVQALPSSYYEILTTSPVAIPKGETKGIIKVQLKDAFFTDPLSISTARNSVNYVIPMIITGVSKIDSVLWGMPKSSISNPFPTKSTDWEINPKNYTLFGIKYINKYHGHYLRRGMDKMSNGATSVESAYRNKFVERDELIMVTTTALNKVILENRVRRGSLTSPGNLKMELTFNDKGICSIASATGDNYNVLGSGKMVEDGDSWGGKQRDVIYLDYSYKDTPNNETHQVKDTLVIRDRDVVFETFKIVPKP